MSKIVRNVSYEVKELFKIEYIPQGNHNKQKTKGLHYQLPTLTLAPRLKFLCGRDYSNCGIQRSLKGTVSGMKSHQGPLPDPQVFGASISLLCWGPHVAGSPAAKNVQSSLKVTAGREENHWGLPQPFLRQSPPWKLFSLSPLLLIEWKQELKLCRDGGAGKQEGKTIQKYNRVRESKDKTPQFSFHWVFLAFFLNTQP